MIRNKIEYFLNALFYGIWLLNVKFGMSVYKTCRRLLSFSAKLRLSKAGKKRFYKNHQIEQKESDEFLLNRKNGFFINTSIFIFLNHCCAYPIFVSLTLCALLVKFYYSTAINILAFVVIAVPIIIVYHCADNVVLKNERYLIYFKKFDEKDLLWRKKWMKISAIFYFGGFASIILGVISMIAVSEL